MIAKIYWYNMLSREHMFCVACYRRSQTPEGRGREPWVRIADPAWFKAGITPISPRTKAIYMIKLRAAFRNHCEAEHPDFLSSLAWARPPGQSQHLYSA
jgi:hypothetical protein